MKFKIQKERKFGEFLVGFIASDFTDEEIRKMETFGVPQINIKPREAYFNKLWVNQLPLNILNHNFKFESDAAAEEFIAKITEEVKTKMQELKDREDNFSGSDEYVF